MYLGIDVGATKTLLAVFDQGGEVVAQQKLATPKTVDVFLQNLGPILATWGNQFELKSGALAVPGVIDRQSHAVLNAPNLSGWDLTDFSTKVNQLIPISLTVENDANAGGLAEACLGAAQDFSRVLYLTISTGVGTGFIVDQQIDPYFADFEGGHLYAKSRPKPTTIEFCISGPAIKRRFGKYGYEITAKNTWRQYSQDVAVAIANFNRIYRPDVVVLGGGVAVHYPKFSKPLGKYLAKLGSDALPVPELRQAKFVETAVIHGCYLLAREL